MIYTVTLNPALDRAITVESLLADDTTRVIAETAYAAGKGIDVSRVIKELGGHSVALGLVGGYAGSQLEGLLINAGVVADFTPIGGETRTNIILKEKGPGRQYVISAAGPQIGAAEIGRLYQHVRELGEMTYLVLSGSPPRGVTPQLYGQLILAGRKNGAFVLLDTDGQALQDAIAQQPTCIKPNHHELARLVGRDLADERQILAACDEIHAKGVSQVIVSRGRQGLIFSCQGGPQLKATSPPVAAESTVGAGDSVVAGFVLAHSRELAPAECLKWGCAAGTATAQTPGTELCHLADVEKILPEVEVTSL
ncbi:MAG: 1-phosphofructokinase [bacterium]